MIKEKLQTVLDSSKGERDVASFLKENPWVLLKSLVSLGDSSAVISEFRIGNEYVADFVVFAPFSGAFEIRFVELEPPDTPIFNKDGTLSKRMNKGFQQVNSWNQYIKKNRSSVLKDLSRHVQEKDLVHPEWKDERTCHVGWPLYHPKLVVMFEFDVIIGRRKDLSDKDMEAKAEFKSNSGVQIVTYDRLLVGASEMDELYKRMNP